MVLEADSRHQLGEVLMVRLFVTTLVIVTIFVVCDVPLNNTSARVLLTGVHSLIHTLAR